MVNALARERGRGDVAGDLERDRAVAIDRDGQEIEDFGLVEIAAVGLEWADEPRARVASGYGGVPARSSTSRARTAASAR